MINEISVATSKALSAIRNELALLPESIQSATAARERQCKAILVKGIPCWWPTIDNRNSKNVERSDTRQISKVKRLSMMSSIPPTAGKEGSLKILAFSALAFSASRVIERVVEESFVAVGEDPELRVATIFVEERMFWAML